MLSIFAIDGVNIGLHCDKMGSLVVLARCVHKEASRSVR